MQYFTPNNMVKMFVFCLLTVFLIYGEINREIQNPGKPLTLIWQQNQLFVYNHLYSFKINYNYRIMKLTLSNVHIYVLKMYANYHLLN